MSDAHRLFALKLVHTVIWAFFAVCILAIPPLGLGGRLPAAPALSGVVLLEVLVVIASGMRCPRGSSGWEDGSTSFPGCVPALKATISMPGS